MTQAFNIAAFEAFCRSKGAKAFDPQDGEACAGYQFLEAEGLYPKSCGITTWTDSAGMWHYLPKRASEAIDWAYTEANVGKRVTFGQLADRLSKLQVESL